MHFEFDYENFTEEEYEIARILTSRQVSDLFDKLVMPVQKRHDQLPLSASEEERQASILAVNKAQDEFDVERFQVWNKAVQLYCDIREGKVSIASQCPNGIKLVNQNMDLDTLRILNFYPGERMVHGIAVAPGEYLSVPDDKLLAEIRLQPEDFEILFPSETYYMTQLVGKEEMSSEEVEKLNFLYHHPNVIGGIMDANLENEEKLLNKLYIEGVPMAQVKEVLLQQPDITQDNLQQILQLYRLKAEGAAVVEGHVELKGIAHQITEKVTDDYRHMYVGPNKPLQSHEYYKGDIREKYDAALKRHAELQLRILGVIPTLPESYRVRWTNSLDNNWECKEMVDIVNSMFQGYKDKIVEARQEDDWMKLDIYTTNPEYRERILECVKCSWAMREMNEVTRLEDMPQEIADARRAEMQRRESALETSVIAFDTIYFFEKGVPGYVRLDNNRSFTAHGEMLTLDHMSQIHDLAKNGNMLRGGTPILSLIGPERLYLDKHDGTVIRACQESVDGKEVLINKSEYEIFDPQSAKYQEITGRISDAKIISNGNTHILRCCIDGIQQPGRKLPASARPQFFGKAEYAELLAIRYFSETLLDSGQEHNIGRGR